MMNKDRIRTEAEALDKALEEKDLDSIAEFFSEDCELELLGIVLKGKKGVRRWLSWMYQQVMQYSLTPVVILIDGSVFFEEFLVRATLPDGATAESKQSEVLIYNHEYKVKSLRLYFDRLDFADAVARDALSRFVVGTLKRRSTRGLIPG